MAEIDWNTKKYQDTDLKDVDVSAVDEKIRSECSADLQGKHRAPKKISESAPLNDKELRILTECATTKRDKFETEIVNEKAAKILADLDRRLKETALDGKQSMAVMPVKDHGPNKSYTPLMNKIIDELGSRNLTVKIEPRARQNQTDPYTHNIVAYWEKWKW